MPDSMTPDLVFYPASLLDRRHDEGTSPYTTKLCPSHGIAVTYVPGELPLEGLYSRYHCQQLQYYDVLASRKIFQCTDTARILK